jgi:hypothetical protein
MRKDRITSHGRLPKAARLGPFQPPCQGNLRYAVLEVRCKDFGNGPEVCFVSAGPTDGQTRTAIPSRELR